MFPSVPNSFFMGHSLLFIFTFFIIKTHFGEPFLIFVKNAFYKNALKFQLENIFASLK